jgi:hypothetical protein
LVSQTKGRIQIKGLENACERGGMNIEFCPENVKERGHPKDLGINGRLILEWILEKQDGKVWIGFIGLRIGIICGLL